MNLHGLITALVTPFKGDLIDKEGFESNVQEQIAAGVNGLIVLGSTGESSTLSDAERELAISLVVEQAKGQVPVIAGSGNNCTQSTIRQTAMAKSLGADIAILIMPYYNRPTQEGMVQHIEAVAKAVSIPLILYNNPSRTGVNLLPETVVRLSQNPAVVGIKETSGSMLQLSQIVQGTNSCSFSVMAGDDAYALPLMALGATGVMSIASNLVPERMVALVKAIECNDYTEARCLHNSLLPLFIATCIESNPMPIKHLMGLCGKPSGPCRLPLCQVTTESQKVLQQVAEQLQLIPSGRI